MDGRKGGWMEAKAGLRIAYSNQKSCLWFITVKWEPGPASSVEDRSLRKIRPRGPRFDPRRGLLFRRELIN